MSIANFQYFHNQDDEELLSNKYNSAAQMFQMSIKVECCNKDVEQFFSSFSVGRNFNLFPILIREPPQFEGSAVRHSSPFVVLVTIFLRKGDETYYSMLFNFSVKSINCLYLQELNHT